MRRNHWHINILSRSTDILGAKNQPARLCFSEADHRAGTAIQGGLNLSETDSYRLIAVHHRRMAATDDKIARCVGYYKRLLDSLPRPPQSLSQAPDSQLHVIVEKAGAQRRSDALLEALDQAFIREGIATYPRLSTLILSRMTGCTSSMRHTRSKNWHRCVSCFATKRLSKISSGSTTTGSPIFGGLAFTNSRNKRCWTAVVEWTSSVRNGLHNSW